ncbi:MAG: helix-turn-helix transcriptional regulator [Clostridia bacterium]|nr:helix-turn-helix transcriptional regulator [Clostridia bacterium]
MATINEIQEKLAEAIKYSGMTQVELSKKLGVSQSVVSHYVKGRKLPALDTLSNLCKVLDLDANDILCIR